MDNREIVYRVVGVFSGFTEGAERARRSARNLSDANDRLAASTDRASDAADSNSAANTRNASSTTRRVDAATRAAAATNRDADALNRATQAVNNNSRAHRLNADEAMRAAQARGSIASATRTLAAVAEQQAQSESRSTRAVQEGTRARRDALTWLANLQRANRSYSGSLQALTRAEDAATRARRQAISAQRDAVQASRAYEAAERSLANAITNHGDNSNQARMAQEALSRAMTNHTNALSRVERATRNVVVTSERLAGEIRTSERTLVRWRNAATGVISVFGGMGTAARNMLGIMSGFAKLSIGPMIAQLIPLIMTLAGSFVSLTSAVSPALGVLGAIPSIVLGASTAFGILAASFGGIGSALKAYSRQQSAASKNSAKTAKAAATQATAIRKAKDAVVRAQQDSARAQAKAARAVSDAEERAAESIQEAQSRVVDVRQKAAEDNEKATQRVRDAVQSAAEDDKKAAQKVASARAQAANTIESAQKRAASAESNLRGAQRDALAAQQDLNRARQDAKQYLEDMSKAARDAALSEEDAAISVEEARNRLQDVREDPQAGDLERRRAELTYREAVNRLSDAQEAKQKAAKENAEAQAKGVEGSDIMIQAQQRAADAAARVVESQQALVESQKELVEAQKDAAQSIADAMADQVKTQQDGAKSIADAQKDRVKTQQDGAKSIADAEKDLAKTQKDAARSVADAKESQAETIRNSNQSVRDAQQNLKDTLDRTSFDDAVQSADAYKQALESLTPSQRKFVEFLISLKPKLDQLKETASAGLLPGVERGIRAMLPLFPALNKGVGGMAKAMGDAFEQAGKAAGEAKSVEALTRVFDSNTKAGQNAADGSAGYTRALIRIMDAARPLTEWIGQLIGDFGNYLDSITATNTENGKMAAFFEKSKGVAGQLGRIIRNLGGMFLGMGKASSDAGQGMLDDLENWSDKMNKLNNSDEGMAKNKKYFDDLKIQFEKLVDLVQKLGTFLKDLSISPGFGKFMDALSKDGGFVDALKNLLQTLNDSGIAGGMADGLTEIVNGINGIIKAGGGGILSTMVDVLGKLFGAFAFIANLPGVGTTLMAIAAGLAAIKAVKIMGSLTGIRQLYGMGNAAYMNRQNRAGVENPRTLLGAGVGRMGGDAARRAAGNAWQNTARPAISRTGAAVGNMPGVYGARNASNLLLGRPALDPRTTRAERRAARVTPAPGAEAAGSDTASGFVRGVRGSAGRVASAARTLGKDFLSAFKLILGIRSPSTVMFTQGEYTIAGLVNALNQGKARVRAAAQNVANSAIAPMRGMANKAQQTAMAGVAPVAAARGRNAAPDTDRGTSRGAKFAAAGGAMGAAAMAASMLPGPMGEAASKALMLGMAVSALIPLFTALSAPILAVVGVLAAIGIALVLLYKKNETFRNFVNAAWASIKTAIVDTWNNYILPALKSFANFITTVLWSAMVRLWENVIRPLTGYIGQAFKVMWEYVIKPAFTAMVAYYTFIYKSLLWLWSNGIKPIASFIGQAFKVMWEYVIKPAFTAMVAYYTTIFKAFMWLYSNGIKPIASFIGQAFKVMWEYVIKPAFFAMVAYYTTIFKAFMWLYSNGIKPIAGWIGQVFKSMWNNLIKPVFTAMEWWFKSIIKTFTWFYTSVKSIFKWVAGVFSDGWNKHIKPTLTTFNDFFSKTLQPGIAKSVSAIATVWNGIKKAFKDPIDFVVNTVYNNGIRKVYNLLADKVGLSQLDEVKLASGGPATNALSGRNKAMYERLATGGKVRGYSAGKKHDNVPAMLTAGEWVQPVDTVKYYGADFMEKIRRRQIPRNGVEAMPNYKKAKFFQGGEVGGSVAPTYDMRGRQQLFRGGESDGGDNQNQFFSIPGIVIPVRTKLRPALIAYGRYWQSRGMRVWQNSAFDGRVPTSGHRAGSTHYADQALDMYSTSNWPALGWAAYRDAKARGFGTVWQSSGHYNHLHVDTGGYDTFHDRIARIGSLGDFTATATRGLIGDAIDSARAIFGGIPSAIMNKAIDPLLKKIPGASSPLGQILTKIPKSFVDKLSDVLKGGAEQSYANAGAGTASGSESAVYSQWGSTVIAALARAGLPTTSDYVWAWVRQIFSESGGNPNIAQQIRDVNGTGENAGVGLVQVIPATFARWRDKSLPNDRRDPLANLVAGMRYAKGRYGSNMLRVIGRGHGYANGGQIPGEGNTDSVPAMLMPGEFVIRKNAVKAIGLENLHALNYADRTGMSGVRNKVKGGVQHFATGGQVAPAGPIRGFKPGFKGVAFTALIRSLFRLPLFQNVPANGWWNDLTNAYAKANYTVPDLSATVGTPVLNDAQAAGYSRWLRGHRLSGSSPVDKKGTLYKGSKNFNDIRMVQKWIGAAVDGQYGDAMVKKVKEWQGKYGLKQTGAVDSATWKALGMEKYPTRYKGQARLIESGNVFKGNPWRMAKIFTGANATKIFKNVLGAYRNMISWDANNWSSHSGLGKGWISSLQNFLGVKTDGVWSTAMPSWIKYMMDKGLGRGTASIFPPWWQLDPIQDAIEKQGKDNANQREFNQLLDTLAGWGLPNLVDKLQTDGIESGLPVARAASKNRTLATQYDQQLKESAELAKTGTVDYSKFIAQVMASGPQQGIRSMAQSLKINDYEVVSMFEELLKVGRLKKSDRTARLERESRQYHSGLFYANTGGRVPGVGNSDTVPAMLTPGEFVLRKAAVKAIGLENLYSMNNVQHFANGGQVFEMNGLAPMVDVRAAQSAVARGASVGARRTSQGATSSTVQNYNTNIYNPIREQSSQSVNRMLRRNAMLGFASVGEDTVYVRGE